MSVSRRAGLLLLGGLLAVGLAVVYLVPLGPGWPAQDPAYHGFADQRTRLGVPNFWNVTSNLPFLFAGLLGLAFAGPAREPWERHAALIFFAGVTLTCFGSSYYHLAPSNQRLFWDRAPMTFAFMALFALVLGERLGSALGRRLLIPLVVVGLGSVVYWHLTEQAGHGDLRPYALVQFFPLVSVPVLLGLLPAAYTRTADYFVTIGWYALAKLLEVLDRPIFEGTGEIMSGHSLKHMAAAVASYWLYRMLRRRKAL
jgi:hypothetical protein